MKAAPFAFFLILAAVLPGAARADARAPLTLPSGLDDTRVTIPVKINGAPYWCVLDTGTSVMLVSESVARAAGLFFGAASDHLAPNGLRYSDYSTRLTSFSAGGYEMHDVPALISSTFAGNTVLCGYDFFAEFPMFIDRGRQLVTLFPTAATFARMHCLSIDLAARVPVAAIGVNGVEVKHVVLDSGMAGGGALYRGVADRLGLPASAGFFDDVRAGLGGLRCGQDVYVNLYVGAPDTPVYLCETPQPPDGYDGIIQTNLPTVRELAVDYPNRRFCFSS
jgi:Aspartyl protease